MIVRAGWPERTIRVNGYRVRVRRQTPDEQFVTTQLVWSEYTPPGFEVRPTDTVIDIGGNIGTFTLHASRCASKGRVFTFEPEGENFRLLTRNLALNRCRNVMAVQAAVAGTSGTVRLRLAGAGGFHSVVRDRAGTHGDVPVEAVSLADIFDRHEIQRCNFLKMDCEGAEYEILYAATPELMRQIDKIAMEYHGSSDQADRRRESDRLAAHLEDCGFSIVAYEESIGFRGGFIRAMRHN